MEVKNETWRWKKGEGMKRKGGEVNEVKGRKKKECASPPTHTNNYACYRCLICSGSACTLSLSDIYTHTLTRVSEIHINYWGL